MVEIICMGEMVVDMFCSEVGVPLEKATSYIAIPGGGAANVATGLKKLKVKSGFIGKVGYDHFGSFLGRALTGHGVNTRGLKFTGEARTTLVFVFNTRDGKRNFVFFRHPGADMKLVPEDIDESLISEASIFHFGSISMSSEPSLSATLRCLEYSHKYDLLISFDPNFRPQVWTDFKQAKERIKEGLRQSDLVRMNTEELKFVTGTSDIRKGSNEILNCRPRIVIITDGERGSFINTGRLFRFVKAPKVHVVDTTGCGDSFTAAILSRVVYWKKKSQYIWDLSVDETDDILMFANAAGALTATGKGVIPSLPTYAELQRFLRKHSKL
jgi:sugar/nucleoside kinase (ribokinase family)